VVLRLHHDKQVQDALHRNHQQATCAVFQQNTGAFKGFTSDYKIDRLAYWKQFKNVNAAIAREKQLKGWRRLKKIQLIVAMNPTWNDMASEWYPELNT
jgi:putative endonuclease